MLLGPDSPVWWAGQGCVRWVAVSGNDDHLESVVPNHLGRSRVEIPIDLVCRPADDQDHPRLGSLAGELFLAGRQKLGRDISVPVLEVPLHIRRSKCLFDLALEIVGLDIEAFEYLAELRRCPSCAPGNGEAGRANQR